MVDYPDCHRIAANGPADRPGTDNRAVYLHAVLKKPIKFMSLFPVDCRRLEEKTMWKPWVMGVCLACISWTVSGREQNTEMFPAPDNEDYRWYLCYRTQVPIKIDGKMDDAAWQQVPWSHEFGDIRTGQITCVGTRAKLLWNDDYLYVAYDLEDPHVWGTVYPRDTWMFCYGISASFVKLYLDPDGDGRNFSEMHLNPANSFWDMFFIHTSDDHPWLPLCLNYEYSKGRFNQDNNPYARLDWNCEGIKTAVYVRGTLNNSNDLDQGWSAEMAIPWKSLTKLTGKGQSCPPHRGDAWAIHLGRRYLSMEGSNTRYMTWPKTNHGSCHEWTTWGRLIFLDHQGDPVPAEMRRSGQRVLTGWGGGDPDVIVPKAAAVGFSEIVAPSSVSCDLDRLRKWVTNGEKYGQGIYAWIFLGDLNAWKRAYPTNAPPLQVMNAAEQQVLNLSKTDKSLDCSGNQEGGEPVNPVEVLDSPLLCFHDPRVESCFTNQIYAILQIPGIKGIALDYFGYQNYRCCHCPYSLKAFDDYRSRHPELSREVALERFSLDTLVSINNRLADYVRTVLPDAKVINHVYPVFLAEPLYGNRLDMDVCGQTAAWFFAPFWDINKIEAYSRVISEQANRYYTRPRGAALIGYFNKPEQYTPKSATRVEAELQAIFKGGCTRVQVCSMNDVLDTPEVAAVFKKYFCKSNDASNTVAPRVLPEKK